MCIWRWIGVSSGNAMALNRRQSITWTNDNPVHDVYILPGLIELTDCKITSYRKISWSLDVSGLDIANRSEIW